MSTLTTKFGVKWNATKYNGKCAYTHNHHSILFSLKDKQYHIVRQGYSLYSNSNLTKCLDEGSEIILDVYATHFKPSWE